MSREVSDAKLFKEVVTLGTKSLFLDDLYIVMFPLGLGLI